MAEVGERQWLVIQDMLSKHPRPITVSRTRAIARARNGRDWGGDLAPGLLSAGMATHACRPCDHELGLDCRIRLTGVGARATLSKSAQTRIGKRQKTRSSAR